MATLTKGMSFRRQGSSGLIWADSWTFAEDGTLIARRPREEAAGKVHPQEPKSAEDGAGPHGLGPRSKSVGAAPIPPVVAPSHSESSGGSRHKSRSAFFRWLKKAFKVRK